MRIALSGSTGLVGSALVPVLTGAGHTVVPIVRPGRSAGPRDGVIAWDGREQFDGVALRGCDAVIHLAGAGIADGRWSTARRRELRDSRIIGTSALARLLAADPGRVTTLITASATGFYGERGEAELDESSSVGSGFLAELCRDWEAAADPCRARIRVAHVRLGVVLSARGGALARMLPAARFGLSGALGNGRQWWPWIALADLLRIIQLVLDDQRFSGPLNALAPQPVRQGDLARALAAALGRPAFAPPVPAWVLRLALGRMADEVLLTSTRALPLRLAKAGFRWGQGEVGDALQAELESRR